MEKVYEGSTKDLYATDTPHVWIQRFQNLDTAFNAKISPEFGGTGELRNRISSMAFRFLEREGIASHYLDAVSARDMRIRQTKPIRLDVVVRNIVADAMARRLDLEEGRVLERPCIEWRYKSDALGDPLLNDEHVTDVLGLASTDMLTELRRQAALSNTALQKLWAKCGLELVDATLEFGTTIDGQTLLIGEVSPNTQHLWFAETSSREAVSFRRDAGDPARSYEQIYERLLQAWPELELTDLPENPL